MAPPLEPWAAPRGMFLKQKQVAALASSRQEGRTERRVKFASKVTNRFNYLGDLNQNPIASVGFANSGKYQERKYEGNVDKGNGVHGQWAGNYESTNAVYNFSRRAMLTSLDRSKITPNQALVDSDFIYKSILGPASEKIEMYTIDGPKPTPSESRGSPIVNDGCSGHSSDSNNSRYKARQTANTKVVHVGPRSLPVGKKKGRGVNGFFPPVKLRDVSGETKRSRSEYLNTPPFMLELAPEEVALMNERETRIPSAKSVAKSDPALCSRQYTFTPPVYPHVVSERHYNDLTLMPKPRMMTSRGELPWVFRHKVKRSMNVLSKIMTSKPATSSDQMKPISYKYY